VWTQGSIRPGSHHLPHSIVAPHHTTRRCERYSMQFGLCLDTTCCDEGCGCRTDVNLTVHTSPDLSDGSWVLRSAVSISPSQRPPNATFGRPKVCLPLNFNPLLATPTRMHTRTRTGVVAALMSISQYTRLLTCRMGRGCCTPPSPSLPLSGHQTRTFAGQRFVLLSAAHMKSVT
jgi:hypothetical protein